MTINTNIGGDRFKIVAYLTEDRKHYSKYDVYIFENKTWRRYPVGGSLKSHCEKVIKKELEAKNG
jgi:hypothetical protein